MGLFLVIVGVSCYAATDPSAHPEFQDNRELTVDSDGCVIATTYEFEDGDVQVASQ